MAYPGGRKNQTAGPHSLLQLQSITWRDAPGIFLEEGAWALKMGGWRENQGAQRSCRGQGMKNP